MDITNKLSDLVMLALRVNQMEHMCTYVYLTQLITQWKV